MYKIQTFNAIADKGLARFKPGQYDLGDRVADAHGWLLRSHKLFDEPVPQSLLAIARAGAGYNNIPVDEMTKRGIVVFNTPGANANAVKELVAAGLFLCSRGIYGGISWVSTLAELDDEAEVSRQVEQAKKRYAGSEIAGKTLGVIGLGAIGSMVANMALELGMRVVGFDPAISVEAAWRLSSRVEKVDSLQALLAEVDYLTLHVPANEHTRHLLNSETIRQIKKGARLLNFARQEVADINAVIRGLDEGYLSRYITDFPHPSLFGRDDVLLLPHLGASTQEAEENCAVMAADQLIEFLENGNIVNSVNFPQTRMARNGGFRITICNENVPRVLGSVLSVLAERNINVVDMVNKSRGEVAYNIIDVETEPGAGALEEIRNAPGVIRVRLV
ncbi:MAG: phosphoglycerate dehydrogenase [Xanthomonadales bacterium]|nr:phosphoglycerate dehydrogenase [Gammaproteobacteria bacterium]NNE06438.1 phosphoglycerate dehydrogenase [Xanthomonadales bacterium]NNL95836.1 phosphoglycerate dehydrogenase [Xanthomonadales bacterium]